MMFFPVLIVAALAVGAVFLFRRSHGYGTSEPSDSLKVLRERYARGEISREQFEEMRETLSREEQ